MINRLRDLPPGIRQTLIYASSLAAVKAVSLIMVPFATHFLTPADYGRLDILQTLADLLSIVIGMGLADTLFRFCGQADDDNSRRKVAANILGMSLVLCLATLIITQLAAPLISSWLPGGITLLQTRLILASLALGGVSLLCLSWLRMTDQPIRYAVGSVGRVLLQALLSGTLLVLGFGVTGFMIGGVIAACLLAAWLLKTQLGETGVRFDWNRYKAFGAYGTPLVFVGLSGFILGSFDRWILADQIGPAAMASYALAAKFGLMTAIMIQPFDLWWLPRRFRVLSEPNGPQRCAELAALGVLIALAAALAVAAVGPLLIHWLTPADYHGAIRYLPWLALLAALHSTNTIVGLGCHTGATTAWPAIIDGCAALLAAIGYLLMIPLCGAMGAIYATAIALSARLLATYLVSQNLTPIPYPVTALLTCAGFALLAILMLQSIDSLTGCLLGGLVALVMLALLGAGLKLLKLPTSNRVKIRTQVESP